MRTVFGIFGKSPFGPLAQHTKRVHDTVLVVRPLMEAFLAGDWSRVEELRQQVCDLEHAADTVKTEIREHLPRSLFLPVDRGDLLLFLREQDAIADRAADIADILMMRRTPSPAGMHGQVMALVDQVIRTSETWYAVSTELSTLQEASFEGAEASKVQRMVNEVDHQEHEADTLEAAALRALFEHEDELGAVSVVFWMNIIDKLGKIADHAENTAGLLRLMMARG